MNNENSLYLQYNSTSHAGCFNKHKKNLGSVWLWPQMLLCLSHISSGSATECQHPL